MFTQTRSWCARFLDQLSQRRRQALQAPGKKFRRRAFLEALEVRQVLHAPIPPDGPVFPAGQPNNPEAHIWEGWLLVSAATSEEHNNQLTISRDDAGTVYIRDAELAWGSTGGIPGAELSLDGRVLIVPGGAITGEQILINGGGGNDNLTLDFVGGNPIPAGGLKFNGGGQTSARGDEITLSTGDVDTVDYVFINENDGSISVDGRTVNYVGLEPVTDNLSATTRSFTFTGPAETITVIDGAVDGMTEIDSDLAGEVVNFFSSPTTSLTIVTGGGDTTNITSFDPGFNAPLISLQGTGATNSYNLTAANIIPNASGVSLTGAVNFNLGGFSEQIASLASTDATPLVTLSAGTLTVGDASNTTYSGVITGAGALTKVGTGTLILSGASPAYTGAKTISNGVLQITQANSGGTGSTAINTGSVFEINNVTHNAAIALNNGGTLRGLGTAARANGVVTVAVGAAAGVTLAATAGSTLTLSDAANDLTGGAGTIIDVNGGGIVALTQNSNAGAAANPVRWNVIGGSSLQISTDAQFGTAPTAATPAFLTLNNGTLRNATTASITMAANRGITLGSGGANFFNATTTNITYGGLISGAFPLNVVGTTGAAGGALILSGAAVNQFTSLNIDNSEVFLSNATTANSLGTGPINITNNGQFNYLNSASNMTIPNDINMASGTTIASRAVGGNSLTLTGVVTLPTSGNVRFDTESTANGPIIMTNPANAVALTGDLTIQVGPTAGTEAQVNLNHVISGTGGIIKTQTGVLQLSGASTYTGVTSFSGGIVNVTALTDYGVPGPLGARTLAEESNVGDDIGLVFRGGTLQYTGATATSTNRQIRVSTAGGTIDASGSAAAGTVSFTHSGANINWFDTAGARTLTLTGTNTGLNTFAHQIHNQAAANLTNVTKTGAGRWRLNNNASTYTGITSFSGGILNVTALTDYGVAGPLGARTLAEESATGDDIGLVFRSGTLQYTGSTAQSTNRQIRVQTTGGSIDASGTGTGTLSFTHSGANINWFDTAGTRTFTLTGTNTGLNTFANVITNQGASATSLTKTGAGLWVLSNPAHTYTGTTTISAGILAVTGTIVGPTVVQNTGALGGGGTTGVVTVNAGGTHGPGNLVGSATVVGNYAENGRLIMEIGSPTGSVAGTDYDQLRVTGGGSVSIGVTGGLNVVYTGTPGTFAPTLGQTYLLVDNVGAAPVAGVFAGLPEGAPVSVDGRTLTISYVGGNGNDITLTAVATIPTIYVDATFTGSGTVDGDRETTGTQSATIGTTAFDSIDNALTALPGYSGFIVVNGGTYASANLTGGGNVTLRLVQDLVTAGETNVTIQNLTGSAGDKIVTRYLNGVNGNLTIEQGNFAGEIAGTGNVTKSTAGTLTLSGQSTYGGTTAISLGTIRSGVNNALPPTTGLTLGTGANVGTLDLATFNQTIGSLTVGTNVAADNVITIGSGRTLTVNGNVTVSNNTATSTTNLVMNGGGALDVNGTNFIVGSNSAAAPSGNTAKLDLSALALVDLTMTGAITIEADGDNLPAAASQIILSNTANILRAPTLTVGGSSTGSINTLTLGAGTNVIQVNTFNIGTGGRDSGNVSFAGAAGSLVVRNQAGTGRATFNLGTGTAATGLTATNTFNVGGHNADLLLGVVNIGTQPRSATWTTTFTFDTGTLDMTSLELATTTQTGESGNGASAARITNVTINLGGGNVTIVNGILAMAEITGDDYTVAARPHTMNATLNISGGTVNIGETAGVSIAMSTVNLTVPGTTNTAALAANATLNISGGTTNLAGSIARNPIVGTSTGGITTSAAINFTGGTLNLPGPIGSAALPVTVTKSTAATATLNNGSTLFGPATVSGGTFILNGGVGALTVDAGATLVPGVTGAALVPTAGNYVQNGALNIQIASPSADFPGIDYDQIKVTGTVTVGGTLNVTYSGTAGTFAGNSGQLYTLIDNDGSTDATTGTFSGLLEGATITVDGIAMRISYVGGDGNDVTLSAVTGPPAVIFVDDDFAASGTVDGDRETAGAQNAVIGTNAFTSIAAALTAYPNYAGVIYVNGGTYASAALAGGGGVSLRLLQDLDSAPTELDVTLQNLTGDANDNITTRAILAANANLIVEQGNFAGVITGIGNLVKTTTGSLTLSGSNNYTGSTTIAAGTIVVGANNALPNGALVLGNAGTVGTLDLTNANQTVTTLNVSSNINAANSIIIGSGRTLTTTGDVLLGVNVAAAADTRLTVTGAGTWTANNTGASGSFALGAATGATNSNTVQLDMSGLATFTANLSGATSVFRVGDSGATGTGAAASDVLLAATSTITANSVLVGTNSGSGNAMRLRLGTGTQVIQTNNLEVANRAGGRSSGTLDFRTATGTLTIRGQAGGTTAAAVRIGENTSATGGALTGLMNFAGHSVDARFSTVNIGVSAATNTGNGSTTHTHTLTFDTGTLVVTGATQVATKTNTWQYNLAANLNIGGGTATFAAITIGNHTTTAGTTAGNFNVSGTANVTIAGAVTIGGKTAAAGTSTATMNVSGGTVNLTGNVVLGNQTATGTLDSTLNLTGGTLSITGNIVETGNNTANSVLTINGGTLDMNGGEIGDAIPINTINLQAGALDSVIQINDGAALSKTTVGTLTILGTNGFTGATTVAAGTLAVTGTMVSAPTVQTGATLTGTGTTGVLTINTGGTHAPGTNVGRTTVNGNYTENGTLQIQIGSATGTVAGTDYDQVRILGSGSVDLTGGALTVTYTGAAGTFNPLGNAVYILIDNDGSDAVVSTFTGLAQGATVNVDGKALTISYTGGDGNDVVLIAPAPTVLYVDDDFPGSGTVDGDQETVAVESAVIGTTAFASVAAALAANPGFSGAIVVNGGTYASALLAGGGNVTLRLVQDGVTEPNVVFSDISGDAGDAIITRFNNVANANVTLAQGSFLGVISGAGSVTKNTAGLLSLFGTNTYTGATTVSAGNLRVTGSIIPSTTTVQTVGTLSGVGTTGPLTVNAGGVHSPGVTTSIMTTQGSYTQNGGLSIDISSIAGTTAGTDYDQVRITGGGSVTLGGTSGLTVNYTGAPGTFNPTTGAIYRIIDNTGATTSGAFAGLPAGSIITVEGRGMQISYTGGDGNDVVLVAQAPVVALYVDDDFPATGTVDGDLETAGPQNAVMGTSAFQSVAAALAANPGYAGVIIVNGGTYASVALAGGGSVTLRLVQDLTNAEPNVTFSNLSGDAGDAIVTRFNNLANANLIVEAGSFAGVISGTGDVVKSNTGTVTLTGASTYSGATIINGGVLSVADVANSGAASPLGSGASITISGNSVLQFTGGAADGTNRTLNISASSGANSPRIEVTNAAGDLQLTGTVAGAGQILGKLGAGSLSLETGSATTIGSLYFAGGVGNIRGSANVTANQIAVGASPSFINGGGSGTLNIQGTATISTSTIHLGENNGGAAQTNFLNQAGGTVTVTGNSGENAGIRLGHWGNETSTYTLSGGTLSLTDLTADIAIATDGTGTFNQTGGALNVPGIMVDHRNATGVAALSITGGTSTIGARGLRVSDSTAATIAGTANVTASSIAIGEFVNSALSIGGSAAVNVTGAVTLGTAAAISGDLNITSSGVITFGSLRVGRGTATITGANVTSTGVSIVGTNRLDEIAGMTAGSTATGVLNIGSGSFTTAGLVMGNANGGTVVGTVNQTGGTVTTTADAGEGNGLRMGHWPTGTANYNLSSGTLNVNGGFALSTATDGIGNFTQTGGTANVAQLDLNSRASAAGNGTFTLNGGTFNVGSGGIVTDGGGGPYTANLGGGILRATADWSSLLNFTLTNSVGPAIIDTNGFNITLSGVLSGAGGLTKNTGAGNLTLSGVNTYTGTTNVNAGVLQLSGGVAILDTGGAVNVGLGGTLQLLANETVASYAGAGDNVGTNDSTLALGAFTLTTTGSAAIANVTGLAGAAITAGTSISDADDDNNVTSPNIVLAAASGVGTSGNPIETTVANLEASGGTGGVFIANSGDLIIGGVSALVGVSATGSGINISVGGSLTINENVAGTGANVALSTVDASTAGQNITLSAATTVSSTTGNVTLSAGNNATLTGNVSSGTTITVNVDFGDVDAAGGIFTLTGTLTAPGGATLNGDSNNDTFSLRPQTGAAITVNGLDPQLTTTGDVLNLDLTGAVNQQLSLGSIGSGVWTFDAPLQTVSYTSIEEMNANAPYHLALNANAAAFGNTGVADEITIRQSGANLIVERTGAATAPDNDDVGVIFQGAIASIQSFTYIGSGDNDILTVSDVGGLPQFGSTAPGIPDNANLPGIGSVLLDGNGGADELSFSLTGANAALTYAIGNGSGTAGPEGEVRVTSGVLSLQAYVVDTELIERTGTGATPGALSILGDSGVNAIAVTASGTDTVVSAAGYPSLSFTGNNFSALTIDGLGNADTIELIGLGTGQTNNAPITLSGGLGDDTLRVHSTSGNTGLVTLNGNAGSDHFILQSATNTVDGIVGPVIVDGTDGIVASNDDRLTIVDSGDATADTVFVNAVNAATSSDYRVEGISSTTGDDVIFRNIDTLTYTGTSGNDTIDAQFVNTSPPHDLSVATLNGWTGGDQFYLFTSDQIGGTAPTPTGTPSGLASIALNGDAPGNPNAGDGNDIFGQTPPGLTGTGAGNAGLAVPDTVRGIRPSASSSITINGGQPTAPVGTPGDSVGDVLNLDLSGVPLASSFVLATLSGLIASPGLEPLNYGQIEDLNFVTNNQLLNLQLGDTLVRATSGPDTIIFSRNPTPTMPNGTRVRLNAQFYDFPMNGKTLTYAGDANDMVTHSNVTFPMEVHGEGGDDYIAGGMGNDFIVGGLGNDQVNASGGDNIVYGDNAPSSADPTPQDSAVGGNDVLSALGGSDVFYGGGGNDSVSPGAGNDYLHGGAGNDILDGHIGDDRVYGGAGNDILSGSEGNDLLSGGEGDDLLLGRDGNDVLIGGGGVDRLDGGSGDDLLVSGSVANEHSSWTSTTNGTTFDGGLYQRASDNDAALLALLTAWSTTGNRSTLSPIANDGVLDLVWGYTGNDDFSITPNEAQDLNSPLMGNDEAF